MFVDVRDSDDSKAGADRITDFAGKDRIDLAAIDAAEDPSGNDRFAFIGDDGFDAEGQLRVMQSGGDTFVLLNTRGAGGAEAMIRIDGTRRDERGGLRALSRAGAGYEASTSASSASAATCCAARFEAARPSAARPLASRASTEKTGAWSGPSRPRSA